MTPQESGDNSRMLPEEPGRSGTGAASGYWQHGNDERAVSDSPPMTDSALYVASMETRLAEMASIMEAMRSQMNRMEASRPIPIPPPPVVSSTADFTESQYFADQASIPYMPIGWEKELPKLTKLVERKKLEPADEKEFEDVIDNWESTCKGAGIDTRILIQLPLHLGSPDVTIAVETTAFPKIRWDQLKDELARELFPYSTYVEELEEAMVAEDRSKPLGAQITTLSRQRKRHSVLCRRWDRMNTFADDRLKDALLRKIPLDILGNCLLVDNYKMISFGMFAKHCQKVEAARQREQIMSKRTSATSSIPRLHFIEDQPMVDAAPVEEGPSSFSRAANITCHNCKQVGHFMKDCPQPRPRCSKCGRLGHHEDTCLKAQHESMDGKTRTGFMRMTRNGVHINLKDEGSRKSFFEAMRKYMEKQEDQCDKAKERAQKRRLLYQGANEGEDPDIDPMDDFPMNTTQSVCLPSVDHQVFSTSPSEVLILDAKINRSNCPFLDLYLFNQRLPALLDSGAVVSLLPQHVWESLPPEQKERVAECLPGSRPLTGLGGAFKVSTIVDLPISIGGRCLLQRFFVTPVVDTPLLGMDALTALGIRVDFASNEVYFPGKKEAVHQALELGVTPLCNLVKEDELGGIPFSRGTDCSEEEFDKAVCILQEFADIWMDPRPGHCRVTTHRIETGDAAPIFSRPRRLAPEKRNELKRLLKELLEAGAITESYSSWASPIVMVPKSSGEMRLCIDYRGLNAVTVRDAYPLPLITELLHRLGSAEIFSTLDLASGFHQIPLDTDSQKKTAFTTPEGLYEYKVLPFGLMNAPGTFQRTMDIVFKDFGYKEAIGIYLDDIVIFTSDIGKHLEVLRAVLTALRQGGMYLNPKKTMLMSRMAKYLGFIISKGEMRPDPAQVAALELLQIPKDVSGIRRFLGLVEYFRSFIPDFSSKALPLTRLLKKATPFLWAADCQKAWQTLKDDLRGPQVRLALPVPYKMFVLDTDASGLAIGVVLMQETEETKMRPISYASRTLTPAEKNWTTRELEAYAVVWGVIHFSPYLRHQPHFIVRTDHQSLRWLWKADNKRIIRWALLLQEYNFTLEYNRGTAHHHADIFSRDTVPDDEGDQLTEVVCAKPAVFTVAISSLEKVAHFPTVDELRQAQDRECTLELTREFKLTRDSQELWATASGRVYLPEVLRSVIMYYFHFGRFGAHQGISKTWGRIKKYFWWSKLKEDIQAYHQKCLTYTRRRPKPVTGSRGTLLSPHVGAILAIDIVGPLKTREGVIHLLTVVDHFTRYAHAAVLSEVTSASIWSVLVAEWISYFGTPVHLLTDNGTVLTSKFFKDQCAEYGIKRMYSFPYHPQGNGIVESFHQFLKRALIASLRQTNWPVKSILSAVLMAYRATPHIATGETPYFLLIGMDMVLPRAQEWVPAAAPEELEDRLRILQEVRKDAFDQVARRSVERHLAAKKSTKEDVLEPGTLVLYWLPPGERQRLPDPPGGAKAAPYWSGPCRVLRRAEGREDTYVISSLWDKGRVRSMQREQLIRIPKTWTGEQINLALYELVADLKVPPKSPTPSALDPALLEGVPSRSRERIARRAEGLRAGLLEEGIGPEDDGVEVMVEVSGDESDESEEPLLECNSRKRPRVAMCTKLREISALIDVSGKEL